MMLRPLQFAALLIVSILAAPSVAPLLDHHFAERQPNHTHLGSYVYHVHDRHPHDHGEPGGDDGNRVVSLYSHEANPAGAGLPATADLAVLRYMAPGSDSPLASAPPGGRAARLHYPGPPDRPPRASA